MAVSYKKLWKILIDRDMKKKDLAKLADVSSYTITKMSKGENVTTDTLGRQIWPWHENGVTVTVSHINGIIEKIRSLCRCSVELESY